MQIDPPVWSLRQDRCTFCEVGELSFFTCPRCSQLALICAECTAVYAKLRATRREMVAFKGDTQCPHCGESSTADFRQSSSEEIQSAGFTSADYT